MAISRIIQDRLAQFCYQGFAIVLIGARQVGKTTLAKALAANLQKKYVYFNCDEVDVKRSFEQSNSTSLSNLLGDNDLIIIDEAQRVENIGIIAKIIVDNFRDKQLLLTGSSALEIANTIHEPLTGRHITFNLYPFSYKEIYAYSNTIEMRRQLAWHLVYGCYPKVVVKKATAEIQLKNLANDYLYKDVLAWKDIRKPDLLNKLVYLLALQMGREVSLNELSIKLQVSTNTVENYIDLLEKSFVLYRLSAYSTNERKEVTKMKKIYFWDNGIRNAILGNFNSIENRTDIGALWENFIITERLKMNHYNASNAKSFFWRSKQQQEIDYVEWQNDNLLGYEFKWSATAKGKPTKAFTNMYPSAEVSIVHNENYEPFVMG
jgi:uncharacterized protein